MIFTNIIHNIKIFCWNMLIEKSLNIALITSPWQMGFATSRARIARLVHDSVLWTRSLMGYQTQNMSATKPPKEKLASLREELRSLSEDDLEDLYISWNRFKSKNDITRALSDEAERVKYNNFPTISFEEFVLKAICEKIRCTLNEMPYITRGS